ncbi:hypothetical protein BD413DRAFT_50877 [Trametes elegans]|nr:hypothetical protein BD413DRAFT_50877 [Trametes elegans]
MLTETDEGKMRDRERGGWSSATSRVVGDCPGPAPREFSLAFPPPSVTDSQQMSPPGAVSTFSASLPPRRLTHAHHDHRKSIDRVKHGSILQLQELQRGI